ncbi:probable Ras GTPase-activating protein [Ceratitis capitata]|uniref:probable Ras GTPase-activating protein n=1 Tax=Ceratitis capitata TaxID=7213 RepID=UPI0006188A47|nr:probable Ras GTPase-activating protein [Ceratitis capitata]
MGRRSFNRVCAISYPSRVEGWLDVCESEGELTRKHKTLPWSPLYCVLQQDEQSFTAYCSEEISLLNFLKYFVVGWSTYVAGGAGRFRYMPDGYSVKHNTLQ